MKNASPDSVNPLDAHLGFWMRFVSNQVSAEFALAVEARGVSVSEWVALRTLHDAPESTHAALVAALGMTKGAVSKVVSRLQDKGLVTRAAHGPRDVSAVPATVARRRLRRLRRVARGPSRHVLRTAWRDARRAFPRGDALKSPRRWILRRPTTPGRHPSERR